ncbi:hypothetical protein ACFL4G_03110 [Thermodesulfobacteriota bacterium]
MNENSANKPEEELKKNVEGEKSWVERNGGLIFILIIFGGLLLLVLFEGIMG